MLMDPKNCICFVCRHTFIYLFDVFILQDTLYMIDRCARLRTCLHKPAQETLCCNPKRLPACPLAEGWMSFRDICCVRQQVPVFVRRSTTKTIKQL